jgi:hypothetical protein
MNVAILVPRRRGRPDRDRLWSFARSWWANDFPDWPIVEGHHEATEGPFNRGQALNRAVAAAGDWDVAVLIDADVIIGPDQVRTAVEVAWSTARPVLAYHERIHLTERGTKRIVDGYRGDWRASGMVQKVLLDACSGAVVVSRPLWDSVGGFDELFSGWGWEDVAFRVAAETLTGAPLIQLAGNIWHLHHIVNHENNPAEPTFVANRARGERYRAARWNVSAVTQLLDEAGAARSPLPPADPLSPTRIPRILHRTVPAETTAEVERWWARFGELHPGWTLLTHRDPLDPADWPETSDLWPLCTSGAQKAGLIRLEALHRWGGVYVDSDVQPFRPFDSLLHLPAFAAWEDAKVVPDAVLGSMPGHPAFAAMLEMARREVCARRGAWHSGPGVTTAILPGRPDVLLLPPGAFYPVHYTEKADLDAHVPEPWGFAMHRWHASWLPSR